jgi:uncharacterized protein
MRRKDKEIVERAAIDAVIRRARICRLAMALHDRPYVIPLCFGYEQNTLYFHSAPEGKKIDILKENNQVCFEFDVDHQIVEAETACRWGMKFRSVVGYGRASFLEDHQAKRNALDAIMRQYSKHNHSFAQTAVDHTVLIKVDIESMTGKESGY